MQRKLRYHSIFYLLSCHFHIYAETLTTDKTLLQVELCCWESYKQHKDKQEKLKYFTTPSDNEDDDDEKMEDSFWKAVKRKGYMLLEKPNSSTPAKVKESI